MRLRELLRLLRLRVAWCDLIRWLAWRVAKRRAEQKGKHAKNTWRDIAAELETDPACVDVCKAVAGDLRSALRRRRLRWDSPQD